MISNLIRLAVRAMTLEFRAFNNSFRHIDIVVEPSIHNGTAYEATFFTLTEELGFGRQNIRGLVKEGVAAPHEFKYIFHWVEKTEIDSYDNLCAYLAKNGIHARIVGSRLLFEVEIFKMKSRLDLHEDSRVIFRVKGRTDLVVLRNADDIIGRHSIRYYIEIKTVKDFHLEHALREAFLQLLGGNVANRHHSPPVLLTNLNSENYVLYLSLVGDPFVELKYKLHVERFSSFGDALCFTEAKTYGMHSCTEHMARKPTPEESEDDVEEEGKLAEGFQNVVVTEVVDELDEQEEL